MKEMVGGCCVCSDDRGWSENPLVYCDGQSCAVAVHQACYGIVTVPSGPWYCRKCESQERSARVRCELCPSRDGALKRTDNQGWAHVVCALYIPEVRFGNVTTMEPIILQLIPQERYNKTCYICQEMGKGSRSTAGACMQCNKSGCKQQFHVTCAQQLGLLCEEAGNYLDNVKYCGYCQHHYSKLKKGGNVKTIPPYKPISHETNSSDGPSSPEKELEPASSGQQQHSSGSAMGGNSNSGSGNMKSNSRMPGGELGGSSSAAASSSSSSSKQRKSSSASKSSAGSSSTSGPTSGGMVSGGSNSLGANSQSTSSASSGMTGMGSGNAGSSTMPGSNNKTSASSSSGSTKDKDKYSKNVNKVSGTNKGHDKEPSSSSSSSSSSSQRDKSSKSSKSSGGTNSNPSGLGSSASNVNSVSSSLGNSLPKENDPLSSSLPSTMTSSSSNKHQDGIKQEKTLAQISSAAASSARAASLSPAAIPTTLIIKPPHDHSGSNKDLLSKEAIAKFTTSNFTETIVVNSDSVFGTTSSTTSNSNSNNAGGPTSQSSGIGSNMAPTSVIENTPGGGSGSGSKQLNMSGGGNSSYSGSGVAKKRKADARSTPTSIASGDIDINRDLIKDVAVSLVPLPLNKNDNIDPASLSGFEKSIKKAKTEPNSPLQPTTTSGDPNLQNVSPNLVQQTQHGSNVISSSSIKHQSQSNSPQLQQQQQQLQQQQQQQQNQPHTPSLVVSVPLSTATVPGINLPTSNSGSSGSSSTTTSSSNNATNSNSNVPPPTSSSQQSGSSNNSSSSGNTPNIISPGQMPPGSSLYQQIAHRSGSDQLLNAHTTNRSSPVIQQPAPSHVIQNAAHSILERHSPSMRSSPSIITSASSQQQHQQPPPQSHNNLFLTAAMDLNSGSSLSGGVSVLQSISPVPPMSAIQSTSSSPITPGGDGGLKITFEKQAPTTNARITALQEQEQQLAGRRSRTPDNSFGSNSSFSGGGGLKFSYEAQTPTTTILSAAANPAQMGATSTIITAPQPMVVKESPPSSPGSDTGGVTAGARGGSNKRNRKLSTNSNAGKSSITVGVGIVGDAIGGGAGPPLDAKDSKLFQNGVVHATHMLGNQLNPNSTVAQKMSDQLCMEVDAHSFVEAPTAMLGPPFPGKSQAARSSNATAPQPAPPSLSSMLSGSGTATANGNTPQSLEQLLERQWEQGSQFLMEQAQHFDIASLLSCLHQLRSENIRLEDHVNNLVARRDHLLAVNARLAIPLNPAAMGGVGLGGGGGGSGGGGASGGTGGGPSGTAGGSGTGSAGSQGQFNNMHGNGPHDGGGSTTTTTSAISSRSSRIQQHQSQQQQQQQQTQSHFGSNSTGQLPLENGIDFRHSNTTHQNTNSSSIRHHSPSSQSYPNPSNSTGRQPPPTSLASAATASSNVVGSMPPDQPTPSSHSRRGGGSSSSNAPSSNSTSSSSSSSAAAASVYQSQQQTIYNTAHQIPLLLEHHQQEHHSQQPPPQQQQQQPPHHLRQTPPTVPSTSRSHGASRGGSNLGPSAHQLHLHHSHPSHHPASSSSSSAHAPHPPPQQQPQHQQPLPQRQRH